MSAAEQHGTRQRVAAALAGAAGLLHLVESYVSTGTLSPLPGSELPALVWATSALLTVVTVLVPVVGGWLALRAPDAGLAVLGVAAVSSLPSAVWMLRNAFEGAGGPSHVITVAIAALLAKAVALLLGARDPRRWRWDRPTPAPFVALAVVAVVGSHQVLVLPLGDLQGVRSIGADFLLMGLVGPAVLAAAALLGARLPRQLGGAMVLAAFVPVVAGALMHASSPVVVDDLGQRAEAFGPLEWVGVAAQVAVIAVAIRWAASSDAGDGPPSSAVHADHGTVAD
jgi:hypothetical protein